MARKRLPGSHPVVHTLKPGAVPQAHLDSAIYSAWENLAIRTEFQNRNSVINGMDERSQYQIYGIDLQKLSDRFFERAYNYLDESILMEIKIHFPDYIEPNHARNIHQIESIINNIISLSKEYINIAIYTYQLEPKYYLSVRSVALIKSDFFIDCIEDILRYNIDLKNNHLYYSKDIISIDFRANFRCELIELSDWANFCSRYQRSSLSSNVSDAVEAKAIAKAIGGVGFRKIVEPKRPKQILANSE